jgi:phosphinothricin acetyltransferase
MKHSDWASVSAIYAEGIAAKKYTIIKELPSFEKWSNDHIKNLCYVAKIEHQIVGFIALSRHNSKANVGVISVYVKNGFKRQGVATKLVEKLKKESGKAGYKALYSFVFFDNIPSIELHKKCGFVLIGTKKLKEDIRNVLILEVLNV